MFRRSTASAGPLTLASANDSLQPIAGAELIDWVSLKHKLLDPQGR
jgi:hypothetical protein